MQSPATGKDFLVEGPPSSIRKNPCSSFPTTQQCCIVDNSTGCSLTVWGASLLKRTCKLDRQQAVCEPAVCAGSEGSYQHPALTATVVTGA